MQWRQEARGKILTSFDSMSKIRGFSDLVKKARKGDASFGLLGAAWVFLLGKAGVSSFGLLVWLVSCTMVW